MVILTQRDAQSRKRLIGRMAGVLLVGSGLLTALNIPLPAAAGSTLDRAGLLVVALVAVALGLFYWFAPWQRWPPGATLFLVPAALSLIALGNYYGGDADPRSYGIFFVVVFVWIGFSHPRWTSLWMAPLAAVAYILPITADGTSLTLAATSAALVIPVCVLLGESLAWGTAHLARTRLALQEERETAARLRALDELRMTFLHAVSHELRTPITISRGHLEVLPADAGAAEVKETVDVVVDELDRMGRIVDDITTLVKVEDPAFLRPEVVRLERFVPEVAAKAAPLFGTRLRTAPSPAGQISVDPQRLTQALLNLLQNAAIHTDGDSPVDLRVVRDGRAWRFEVEDHGGGLPKGAAERLFQPFRRGSTAVPGTGLGLAIVRGIAEAHGGAAGATNRPGVGAIFWVEIPG
jgi:signal transduction histidine kinase